MSSSFDAQAETFDLRAGFPERVRTAIAHAVAKRAGLSAGDGILEIGAGTGIVGRELVALGLSYIGLDPSEAMLDRFRALFPEGAAPPLCIADANEMWPVPASSLRAVFGSRSLHWLEPEHVAREAARVASVHGCTLIIGRVERDRESVRARLRRKLHELLRARGVEPRSGSESSRAIEEACRRHGATVLEPEEAATWAVSVTARAVLSSWRAKPGIAGRDLSPPVEEAVLNELESWTSSTFGHIDRPLSSIERYVLRGAAFGGSPLQT